MSVIIVVTRNHRCVGYDADLSSKDPADAATTAEANRAISPCRLSSEIAQNSLKNLRAAVPRRGTVSQ